MSMTEVWKSISGFPNYMVSNLGRVKSLSRLIDHGNYISSMPESIKSQRKCKDGYLMCDLFSNGVQKTAKVHRLVAEAFLDNPENKPTVNHKNANKTDNTVSNLEWATMKEQSSHAFETGRMSGIQGERSNFCKINASDVLSIRELKRTTKVSNLKIGGMFGISASAVSVIVNKKTWKHLE